MQLLQITIFYSNNFNYIYTHLKKKDLKLVAIVDFINKIGNITHTQKLPHTHTFISLNLAPFT